MGSLKEFFTGPVTRVARQTVGVEAYQKARDMGRSRCISLGRGVGEFVAPALSRVYRRQYLVTETSSGLGLLSFVRDIGQLTLAASADVIGGVGGMTLTRSMISSASVEDAMQNLALQWGVKLVYNAAAHTTANLLEHAQRPNISISASVYLFKGNFEFDSQSRCQSF